MTLLTLLLLLQMLQLAVAQPAPIPEQVHISLGTTASEMLITWSTLRGIDDEPFVEYGLTNQALTRVAKGEMSLYARISLFTYRALLTDLQPLTRYYYRVGSNGSLWSETFHFKTLTDDHEWLPTVAIYGDLGLKNGASLPYLIKDVEEELYSAIMHIGDIGYDLYERGGKQGNDFMNAIQPLASRVPLAVCPGNHDRHDNFSHYDARFSMLGDRDRPNTGAPLKSRLNNHYHSFNIGPAHFIMFSTEFYYYTYWGWEQIRYQYEWLEKDLIQANKERDKRPWIIVLGHKPMYCTNFLDHTCNQLTMDRPKIRTGIRWLGSRRDSYQYGLENLFYKHGVDVYMAGHEHSFIRLFPVFLHQVQVEHEESPYFDPKAPVHITTGAAGNREMHAPLNPFFRLQTWAAQSYTDFGYGRIKFLDRRTAALEQISVEKGGIVIDRIEIKKSGDRPIWMP